MSDPPRPGRRPADSSPEQIRTRFDWDTTAPSMAVVDAVAIARNEEPLSLPPLYARVDPDALDALVTSTVTDGTRLDVSFSYASHDVTVTVGGAVAVTPR